MINVVVHPLLPLMLIVLSFIARRMVDFFIRVILALLNTIVLSHDEHASWRDKKGGSSTDYTTKRV